MEMPVQPLGQMLRKQPFQFRERQFGDGLGCVVAFGDETVDVGPAQAPEADTGEGQTLFRDTVDQALGKILDPGDGPLVPADLPGQCRQGLGQKSSPTRLMAPLKTS